MASRKGTTSSMKKKAKLQQQQQCLSSERSNRDYSSPLNHLKDAQGFSEKLFSRLQSSSNEKFEAKTMMLKVIARTIGLHHLVLLDFYLISSKEDTDRNLTKSGGESFKMVQACETEAN
ncbi:hypothetical protein OROGR_026610 [Orobanche gracilis]